MINNKETYKTMQQIMLRVAKCTNSQFKNPPSPQPPQKKERNKEGKLGGITHTHTHTPARVTSRSRQ